MHDTSELGVYLKSLPIVGNKNETNPFRSAMLHAHIHLEMCFDVRS